MKKVYILLNGRLRTLKEGLDAETAIDTLKAKGYQVEKVKNPPTHKTLERWVCDGVAKATDGCKVEPDGECIHGKKSWLLVMGII